MMIVYQAADGFWRIQHANKTINQVFKTEGEAEAWGDMNIDDQMFDQPNWLSEPLEYIEDNVQ